MPAVSCVGDKSAGHGSFPPTAMTASPATKTKINGKKPGLVDSGCKFAPHSAGRTTHPDSIRYPSSGSTKTYIDGKPVARIGDPLADGDVIAQGSSNTFVE